MAKCKTKLDKNRAHKYKPLDEKIDDAVQDRTLDRWCRHYLLKEKKMSI